MTIILFHGLGSSKKLMNYLYYAENYHQCNFIKELEKIDKVLIPEIPYTNVNYYYSIMKPMFKPIDYLDYDDLKLDKFIKLLILTIKKDFPPPYIVMGHSHGIYYACEFAKQNKKHTKYIISLDGSWITNALNHQRLSLWAKKNKIIPKINNQSDLDEIIFKIKHEADNSKYINMIFDYVRGTHTQFCIKQNYEKLKIPFITFRDFNSTIKTAIDEQYNNNVIEENSILYNYNNHIIYVLLDATHDLWLKPNYKNTIIQTLNLINIEINC